MCEVINLIGFKSLKKFNLLKEMIFRISIKKTITIHKVNPDIIIPRDTII